VQRCPEARVLLPDYVEGELSALQCRLVEGHLQICAACRQEEAQYRKAFVLLRASRLPAPPGDLYAGFVAKLARLETRVSSPRLRLGWATGLAGLLLFIGAGASILHLTMTPEETPRAVSTSPPPIMQPDAEPSKVTQKRSPAEKENGIASLPDLFKPRQDPFDPRGAFLVPLERHAPPDQITTPPQGEIRDSAYPKALPERPHPAPAVDHRLIDRTNREKGMEVANVLKGRPGIDKRPARRVVVLVPELNEHVRIGDKEFVVRSESGWDANGELALIRIKAEATPSKEKGGAEEEERER